MAELENPVLGKAGDSPLVLSTSPNVDTNLPSKEDFESKASTTPALEYSDSSTVPSTVPDVTTNPSSLEDSDSRSDAGKVEPDKSNGQPPLTINVRNAKPESPEDKDKPEAASPTSRRSPSPGPPPGSFGYNPAYPPPMGPTGPPGPTRRNHDGAKQIGRHMEYIEDRFDALERMVINLKNEQSATNGGPPHIRLDNSDNASTNGDEKGEVKPIDIPHVVRCTWQEYLLAREYPTRYPGKRCIEVPIGILDSKVREEVLKEFDNNGPRRAKAPQISTSIQPPEASAVEDGPGLCPSRIRINSPTLMAELTKLTKVNFYTRGPPTEMLYPFKALVSFDSQIREHMKTLETESKSWEVSSKTVVLFNSDDESINETGLNHEDIEAIIEECKVSRTQAIKCLKDNVSKEEAANAAKSAKAKEEKEDDEQESERKKTKDELSELISEWKCLVELIEVDLKSILDLRAQIREGTLREITFKDVWHLFSPGCVVYASSDKTLQALRVLGVTGGRQLLSYTGRDQRENSGSDSDTGDEKMTVEAPRAFTPFVVDCYHFDFNGTTFGPVQRNIIIRKFPGTKAITSLEVYPANLNPKAKDYQTKLMERGEKFLKLSGVNKFYYKHYRGLSLDSRQVEIDSRVIIDCSTALLLQPHIEQKGLCSVTQDHWTPQLGLGAPTEPRIGEVREPWEPTRQRNNPDLYNDNRLDQQLSRDFFLRQPVLIEGETDADDLRANLDHLILLPYKVFGFVLRTRKWASMHLDRVTDVSPGESNFENLVLQPGHADLVQALVTNHSNRNEDEHEVDLVKGKGKGLIILLHGAPGVGKTSTAECVAEKTERPLFPITCGDIGSTAMEVDINLTANFQLAHKWKCVLLLDEADVFLAKRDKTNLERNAIVSVFLRVLEYYAGILFLTTNRVGHFDDAFKSRIHMSLYYPVLDARSNEEIWRKNLERTRNMLGIEVLADEIMRFANKSFQKNAQDENSTDGWWNGRQIRNAFQTAIALAKWDAQKLKSEKIVLGKKQFQAVAKMSKAFDEYIDQIHGPGGGQGDRALQAKERADGWVPGAAQPQTPSRPPPLAQHRNSRSTRSEKYRSQTPVQQVSPDSSSDDY